jgi:hypothetical protein
LVLTVGVTAAIGISLIAGARRSASVVDRFFASATRYDVRIASTSPALQPDAVAALPGVDRADPTPFMAFLPDGHDKDGVAIQSTIHDFTQPNGTIRLLRGRMPRSNPSEVVVNQAFVDHLRLTIGDRIGVRTFARDQYDEVSSGVYSPRGPHYDFTIVGVIRVPDDIATDVVRSTRTTVDTEENLMLVTAEFWFEHRGEFIDFGNSYDVRLRDGAAAIDSFLAAARRLAGADQQVLSTPWEASDRRVAFVGPVAVESNALLGVGIGATLGALGTAVLLIRLEARRFDNEHEALSSIGITTGGMAVVSILRLLPASIASAAVAICGAVLLSPRYPIGIGRLLEPSSGLDVNVALLALAALLTIAIPLLVTALFAIGTARPRQGSRSRPATFWASTRLPLYAALGGRVALGAGDRRRRTSNVVGIGVAVVAFAAAIAVGAWLTGTARLYDTPAARGWVWDVSIGNVNFPLDPQTATSLTTDSRVKAATGVRYGQATLDGFSTEVLAFDLAGTAPPKIIRGRLPASPTEAALGEGLLRTLHHHIGDTVTLSLEGSEFVDQTSHPVPVTLTIVGESVSPVMGESDLADVAVIPLDAIAMGGADSAPQLILMDVRGKDRRAVAASIAADHTEEVQTDLIPSRIVNLHRVRAVPFAGLLLALLLTLVTLGATTYAASTSSRKLILVLSALGVDSRSKRMLVTWQGLIAAAAVLTVGLPLGLLADLMWWRRQITDLGLRAGVPAPAGLLVLLAASIVAGALAFAHLAARRSRPTTVAAGLRVE